MTPDQIPYQLFKITSIIAGIGWIIILFLSPFWMGYDKFVIGVIVVLLALTYTALNLSNFDGDIQKFLSLKGVLQLFRIPYLVDAAWNHFLAFDLLVAVWIKNNSVKHGIGHGLIIPALIFTCALGPLGFIIYLITRWIKTKNYFAENF